MSKVSGEELHRWKHRFLLYYLNQSSSPLIPEWIRRKIRKARKRLDKVTYKREIEELWKNRDRL